MCFISRRNFCRCDGEGGGSKATTALAGRILPGEVDLSILPPSLPKLYEFERLSISNASADTA